MQKNYYAIIPAGVRYDKELPPAAKLLYGEITALCNQEGYCWATNKYFAELYEVSEITISRWISALFEKSYITVKIDKSEGNKRMIQLTESLIPINKNVKTPLNKNVKHNNTILNNTTNSNTTLTGSSSEQQSNTEANVKEEGKKVARKKSETDEPAYTGCKDIYNEFICGHGGVVEWQIESKPLKQFVIYLRGFMREKMKREPETDEVVKAFDKIFKNRQKWGKFEHKLIHMRQVNQYKMTILMNCWNGKEITTNVNSVSAETFKKYDEL